MGFSTFFFEHCLYFRWLLRMLKFQLWNLCWASRKWSLDPSVDRIFTFSEGFFLSYLEIKRFKENQHSPMDFIKWQPKYMRSSTKVASFFVLMPSVRLLCYENGDCLFHIFFSCAFSLKYWHLQLLGFHCHRSPIFYGQLRLQPFFEKYGWKGI